MRPACARGRPAPEGVGTGGGGGGEAALDPPLSLMKFKFV